MTIIVDTLERYINRSKTLKNSCANPMHRVKSAYVLYFLRYFYRSLLLFLNLINTDIEPSEIVSRTYEHRIHKLLR